MASNKVLDIGLATLLGAIIGAIIAGLFSLITTAMQINANSNSSETNHSSIYNSEPDSSHLDTSTSENSTNDSTPYTAETNDSNIVETIDEKESSNCGFIDNPIHKNVTEEKTNEEPKVVSKKVNVDAIIAWVSGEKLSKKLIISYLLKILYVVLLIVCYYIFSAQYIKEFIC